MEQKIPPIQTLTEELALWTLNHTAGFPKSQRFTLGQRMDNITLDVVELVGEARFARKGDRVEVLGRLNVILEKLRVLWRIIRDQTLMSEDQARHVHAKINEMGRMAGQWIKATAGASDSQAG